MKPYEIYNLWVLFDKATSDPAFSVEQKTQIGADMLAALPPEMLCSGSKPSLAVVKEAMEGRLHELNSQSTGKTGLRTGTSPVAGAEGNDAKANAGSGVPMADMAHTSEPAKQTRKGRKTSGN